MGRKLQIYINPSWSIHRYEDYLELPEGWDLWTEGEQEAYVQECIQAQIEDSGYNVVEVNE